MAAALYATAAVVTLWILHRRIRPLSPAAATVLLLLPLCFTGRALLTGRVYAPIDISYSYEPLAGVASRYGVAQARSPVLSDVQLLMIPWRAAVRDALSRGEWPLWNPYIFCGDILAANSEPAPYHPTNLLSLLIPLPDSLTFVASFTFLLAAMSMFAFVRELGCDEVSAVFGAAAWMFSTFLVFFIEYPMGNAVLLLPLICFGVRRIMVATPGMSRHAIALLTTGLVVLILAGHAESTLHVAALGALYALAHLPFRSPAVAVRIIGRGLLAGLLAILLSAMFLLPFVDALVQSHDYAGRVRDYTREDRSASWSNAAARLWTNVIPFIYGWPAPNEPRLPRDYYTPHASYAGSLLFPLAIVGLRSAPRRETFLLSGFLLLGCLAGAAAPGVADVLARLPLFSIAINERLIFAATFALVVAASFGVGGTRMRPVMTLAVTALVAVILLVVVALKWKSMLAIGLDRQFVQRSTLWFIAPPAAAVILFAVPTFRRAIPAALVGLLLVQRSAEVGGIYPVVRREAFFPNLPLLVPLQAEGRVSRVTGTGSILPPNMSTHYRLEDPRGFTGMTFARLMHTFPLWSVHQPIFFNRVDDVDRPFLRFLNVRYALVSSDAPVPSGWRVVARSGRTVAIENPSVLPRAFVPPRVRVNLRDYAVVDDMYLHQDFGRVAWINVPGAPRSDTAAETENGPGSLVIQRSGSGYAMDVTMTNPGWLVVSETAWRGWKVFVNGESVPIAFANHAFIGFHLPRGRHSVVLRYWPDSFSMGLAISAATALALTVAAVRRSAGSFNK